MLDDAFRLSLDQGNKCRVHLNRVKRECHRTNKFVNEANQLLASSTTVVCLDAHVVVDVQKLKRVLGLDQNHAMALLDVLDDLAELNKLIKVI